jgi:serine/threonine protein kinase
MLVDEAENKTRARGEYALLEVMGDPGSEVFRARTHSGRSVVLRFWRGGSELETRSALELLEQAVRVQNPMLAMVYRCERFADGSLRVVSEYVPGRSLDAWVGETGIPPLPIGIDFVRRLALGLADAHRLGVTHHALYPGNIVVLEPETRPHGRIAGKLVDLGVARAMRSGTRFEAAHFIAPEALAHELAAPAELQQVDVRMNVYSCGCLLHYLSTGQPPYQSDSLENLRALHESGRPALPARLNPKIPADLARVICQALDLDPRRRTPDMAALARALSHVESQWRSSSVRRRAQPPPLPVREEPVAPQPSAAAPSRLRLAPAIAAALALRPVPKRAPTPPEPAARKRRASRGQLPAPPPAATPSAPQPKAVSPIQPPPSAASSDARPAPTGSAPDATSAIMLEASEVALLPAAELSPLELAGASEAIVLEPAEPATAPETVELERPPVAAVEAVGAAPSELAPTDGPTDAIDSSAAAPPVVAGPGSVVEPAATATFSDLGAIETATVVFEPSSAAMASVATVGSAADFAAATAGRVSDTAIPAVVVVTSEPVIPTAEPSVETLAAAPIASDVGESAEVAPHQPERQPSVVVSEILFARNSLSPVEVAGRRRSDGLPGRMVQDVVVAPPVAVAPASRHWRWGAAALAGGCVYWLLMTLSSAPEPAVVTIPLATASVARAPELEPLPAPEPPPVVDLQPSQAPPIQRAPDTAELPREREPRPRAAAPRLARQEPQVASPASTPDPLDSIRVDLPAKVGEPVIAGAPRVVRLEPVWSTPNVVAFSESDRPQPSAAGPAGRAKMRTESIVVHGSLTIGQARRAIERITPQLRTCYVDRGPGVAAGVQVELIIDDVGRVRNLQVRGAVPSLAECVVQVSRKLMSGLPYSGAAKVSWNVRFE